MTDDSTPDATCTACGETKPLASFPKARKRHRAVCKACFIARSLEQYREAIATDATKPCVQCGNTLPIAAFGPKAGGRSGAASKCKECLSDNARAFAAANPAKIIERRKRTYAKHSDYHKARRHEYRQAHPEETKQYQREWYRKNAEQQCANAHDRRVADLAVAKERDRQSREQRREQRIADAAAWRASNPQKYKDGKRSYRQRHPERVAEHQARRRERLLASPVIERIDRKAIVARDNSTCYLCKRTLSPHEITLDHYIPLSAGGPHTMANLRVACRPCNSRKWNHLPSDV